MYRGIVREVFIPGIINNNGSYSGIMEAKYIGFKIQLLEYCSDNCISKDNVFVDRIITVIEPDTNETAVIYKGDRILINSTYFIDACECMMSITDNETYMLLNLSTKPYIKLDQ